MLLRSYCVVLLVVLLSYLSSPGASKSKKHAVTRETDIETHVHSNSGQDLISDLDEYPATKGVRRKLRRWKEFKRDFVRFCSCHEPEPVCPACLLSCPALPYDGGCSTKPKCVSGCSLREFKKKKEGPTSTPSRKKNKPIVNQPPIYARLPSSLTSTTIKPIQTKEKIPTKSPAAKYPISSTTTSTSARPPSTASTSSRTPSTTSTSVRPPSTTSTSERPSTTASTSARPSTTPLTSERPQTTSSTSTRLPTTNLTSLPNLIKETSGSNMKPLSTTAPTRNPTQYPSADTMDGVVLEPLPSTEAFTSLNKVGVSRRVNHGLFTVRPSQAKLIRSYDTGEQRGSDIRGEIIDLNEVVEALGGEFKLDGLPEAQRKRAIHELRLLVVELNSKGEVVRKLDKVTTKPTRKGQVRHLKKKSRRVQPQNRFFLTYKLMQKFYKGCSSRCSRSGEKCQRQCSPCPTRPNCPIYSCCPD